MQRVAGAYIGKKIKDELFSVPKPREAAEQMAPTGSAAGSGADDDLDGTVVEDEDERAVGTAHRVPGVGVYVAYDGYGNPQRVLADCVGDPAARLLLTTDDKGRITALIYVPDPSRAPRRPEGMRADDV